ncbi:ComF family protein [Candidatus Nomurabacteria bacterium]|nr:ComF family protein [Candidatus Nomurabacteria bacterium]
MKILKNILDYIWPQFCLLCKKEGFLCCPDCQNSLKFLPLDYQAWPEEDFTFEHCYVCLDYHQELTQKLIKTFKYQYLQNISEILIKILAQQISRIQLPKNTLITNVPLHKKKKRQRGFDQTEILAQGLAKKINLPYLKLLKRQKFTSPQAQLSKTERQKNVSDAFVINKNLNFETNSTIILIDDVATTGATLNQAAKVLKDNGFQKIIALTLAKN